MRIDASSFSATGESSRDALDYFRFNLRSLAKVGGSTWHS
jgi:hypothetical protein